VHVLIDADVIDSHSVWESEVFEIDVTKVFRHAQVNDDVLGIEVSVVVNCEEGWRRVPLVLGTQGVLRFEHLHRVQHLLR